MYWDGENMRSVIYKMITDQVEKAVDTCMAEDGEGSKVLDVQEMNELLIPRDSHHAPDTGRYRGQKIKMR